MSRGIWYPEEFCVRLNNVLKDSDKRPKPEWWIESNEWTAWFEERMCDLEKDGETSTVNPYEYYCQNKKKHRDGSSREQEWMEIDHVFMSSDPSHSAADRSVPADYNSFPLVVVEHEHGGFGSKVDPSTGQIKHKNNTQNSSIEWAFWKCLSMRCKLSVLVAYPAINLERSLANSLARFNTMASGWLRTYADQEWKLNCLVLLGRHKDSQTALPNTWVGEIYSPFVPRIQGTEATFEQLERP
ncbi:MAG: hypothetical protein MUC50_24075 [Myxococcota bacterium]|jgi:hypothetical protein|nr:hypothetical protein [Myxococcota bacterium]